MKTAIVVTGLPASGKTTIAKSIAGGTGFVLLDKDDFLENLYGLYDVRTLEDRKTLSRKSDTMFQDACAQHGSAVLVSHWRPVAGQNESGTPTDWLQDTYDRLIEVACLCPAETALSRFSARSRHPGHMDQTRDKANLAQQFNSWESRYPLCIGHPITVNTGSVVNVDALIDQIRTIMTTADTE